MSGGEKREILEEMVGGVEEDIRGGLGGDLWKGGMIGGGGVIL